MKYLIIALFMVGCADKSSFNRTYPKRPEVIAALDSLNVIVPKCTLNREINIVFDADTDHQLPSNTLGRCLTTEKTKIRDVVINRARYDQYKHTPYYLEMLVLHELGHCEYGLGHENNTIMSAYANYLAYSNADKIRLMKKFEKDFCE